MNQIKIKAEPRTEQGTGAVRRLRRTGMIPGSVMKMKKGGTELIKLPEHDFMMAMRGRTGKQVLVSLDMGGKEMSALLREMQNDVLKGTPIHVDFSEVSLSEKVRITVPEDLEYGTAFADLFDRYTTEAKLVGVKTTNLGSLNRLSYNIRLKEAGTEKALIDDLRVRNGNLEINMMVRGAGEGETL